MPELFPAVVYSLCLATSSACAGLLARSYFSTRAPLLLWSALCFFFLAANNLLVLIDMLVIREVDLRLGRLLLALAAASILLFGFVWDTEER